jgi:hypothetical protein
MRRSQQLVTTPLDQGFTAEWHLFAPAGHNLLCSMKIWRPTFALIPVLAGIYITAPAAASITSGPGAVGIQDRIVYGTKPDVGTGFKAHSAASKHCYTTSSGWLPKNGLWNVSRGAKTETVKLYSYWRTSTKTNPKAKECKLVKPPKDVPYDAARASEWAQFLVSLPHSSEMRKLTARLSPYFMVQSSNQCGKDALACYDPSIASLYISWEKPPPPSDSFTPRQIAAHEYGHHIAASRWKEGSEDPLAWGPQRWSTAMQVCERVISNGKSAIDPPMYPGDEGKHYEDNPGEIWAEDYRIYAASINGDPLDSWDDSVFNPVWQPSQGILSSVATDVTTPWAGLVTKELTSRLDSGRPSFTTTVPVSVDGIVRAWSVNSGDLKTSITVGNPSGSKGLLLVNPPETVRGKDGKSHQATSRKFCNTGSATVTVTRKSGAGNASLSVQSPGT